MKKEVKKKRVLFIADGIIPTGFSTVSHNIIKNLDSKLFEIHHLAVNYYGDPHGEKWKAYPASIGGDIWGFNRIKDFAKISWSGIFILNDVWVIAKYLKKIKETFPRQEIPPIVVYFPVDATTFNPGWFDDFDIVSKTVVYTNFGYNEVVAVNRNIFPLIIPHGVETRDFYPLKKSKVEIRSVIFPKRKDFLDAFIVLSTNRNQPRKRYDLLLEGFKLFSENKPDNVKLYCHAGITDAGFDLPLLSFRLGIDKRLVITSTTNRTQKVPTAHLNVIYNACDVGITVSTGEGWGLCSTEGAATGSAQIVPNHSACAELFGDCGILIPVKTNQVNMETSTIAGIVTAEDIAKSLELVYSDSKLLEESAKKCYDKFTAPEYIWKNIVNEQWLPIFLETFND